MLELEASAMSSQERVNLANLTVALEGTRWWGVIAKGEKVQATRHRKGLHYGRSRN